MKTNKFRQYDDLPKEQRDEIESFVAEDSELEGIIKDPKGDVTTLWKKKEKYCVIRCFMVGISFEVSVDYPYTEAEKIVKRLFETNPHIFIELMRG